MTNKHTAFSANFWDKRAQSYDSNITAHNLQYQRIIDKTISLVEKGATVLDFGCASGEISRGIAPYVKSLHGVDISPQMIHLANQKAMENQADNLKFSVMDIMDVQLDTCQFDIIIAFNILHLVDDAHAVINRIHQLLKSGGILISQTPCLSERHILVRTIIHMAQVLDFAPSIHSFTANELEENLRNNHFRVIETTRWDTSNQIQWITAQK